MGRGQPGDLSPLENVETAGGGEEILTYLKPAPLLSPCF